MKKLFLLVPLALFAFPLAAFDRQPTLRDTYQDVRTEPLQITEKIFTLSDQNGKYVELPTLRKNVKYFDWQRKVFVMVQYNDAGMPYLYEKVTFSSDGLLQSSVLKTRRGLVNKEYEYTGDYAGYDVYSVTDDGNRTKVASFELERDDEGYTGFDYSYDKSGAITKTKKTTGYGFSGDLRQDAQNELQDDGTVYYYFYENGKLSSIITETDTGTKRRRTYYVNNKKTDDELVELNDKGDVTRETTLTSTYIYKYIYDSNKNWVQKDSFYEDKTDDLKYRHPLLRTRREIVYSGTVAEPEMPDVLYSFETVDDKQNGTEKTELAEASGEAAIEKDASIVPATSSGIKPFTSERTDPMDDKKVLYIVFNAPQKVNAYVENVSLIIRKKEGHVPELYINWKEFISQGPCFVTYRIDNEPARTEEWTVSTDEKASFYDGDTTALLDKLRTAQKFIARTTPFNEVPCTAEFDVSSLRNLDASYSWLYARDYSTVKQ